MSALRSSAIARGLYATWSRMRRELFYQALDNRIMVAASTVNGDSLQVGKPAVLV